MPSVHSNQSNKKQGGEKRFVSQNHIMMDMNKRTSWIIGALTLSLVLVLTICLLCSCSGSKQDETPVEDTTPVVQQEANKDEGFDKDIYVIDIEKDSNGNVLHKTVFNAVTKHTYIYTFTYNANAWGMNVSTSVVIVNEDGSLTVPSVENELPVNPVG